MSQTTLIENIGALATAVENNQRLIAEAVLQVRDIAEQALAKGIDVDEHMDSESENPLMNKTIVELYSQIYGSIREVEDLALAAQQGSTNHEAPDVMVATAQNLNLAAASSGNTYVKIALTNAAVSSGNALVLRDGSIVCNRAGIVAYNAYMSSAATNQSVVNYSRIRVSSDLSGPLRTAAATGPAAMSSHHPDCSGVVRVAAGEVLTLSQCCDSARNATAWLEVCYLSANGLSAYQIAVKNGFDGTEEEWLATLVGPQGPQGEPASGATAAHAVMPSSTMVYLVLPSSQGTITAPDDGYIYFAKTTTSANQYVGLTNITAGMANTCWCPVASGQARVTIAVSKGDTVRVLYTADGATETFRFTYCNGSATGA